MKNASSQIAGINGEPEAKCLQVIDVREEKI
jgi:hypothetical protein